MKKITARRLRIVRENGRVLTQASGKTDSSSVNESVAPYGKFLVRVGGSALSKDRELQIFDEALRDSIRQNKGALKKLSKR